MCAMTPILSLSHSPPPVFTPPATRPVPAGGGSSVPAPQVAATKPLPDAAQAPTGGLGQVINLVA